MCMRVKPMTPTINDIDEMSLGENHDSDIMSVFLFSVDTYGFVFERQPFESVAKCVHYWLHYEPTHFSDLGSFQQALGFLS